MLRSHHARLISNLSSKGNNNKGEASKKNDESAAEEEARSSSANVGSRGGSSIESPATEVELVLPSLDRPTFSKWGRGPGLFTSPTFFFWRPSRLGPDDQGIKAASLGLKGSGRRDDDSMLHRQSRLSYTPPHRYV